MDQVLRCVECGTDFLRTDEPAAGEQADPVRCPMCQRLAPPLGRTRGVVKWFSRGKGYGFITPTEGDDVFLHKSGLGADSAFPRAGQLVEFSLGHGPRGAQAEAVQVLDLDVEVAAPQTI